MIGGVAGFIGGDFDAAAALCLILAGGGLLLSGRGPGAARAGLAASALLLIAIAAALLGGTLLGLDVGTAIEPLHRLLGAAHLPSARMSPIAGVGFLLDGLVLLLLIGYPNHRIGAVLLEILVFILIVCGIVGLMSNWLNIEALYGWRNTAPVGIPLGVGLTWLSAGAWLRFRKLDAARTRVRREEWDLTIIAGEILAVVAVVAGLSVFAMLQRSMEAAFADALEDNLADRRRGFENFIQDAMQANAMVANRPVLALVVDRLGNSPDEAARAQLDISARTLLSHGYKQVTYFDRWGNLLATAGDPRGDYDLVARLNTLGGVQLAWGERGFVLIQRLPMMLDGKVVGTVQAERYLRSLTIAYHNVGHIGATADSRLCALATNGVCFPSVKAPVVATNESGAPVALPLPASLGLDGLQGFIIGKDDEGEEYIAAYGPVGTLGLGLMLKVDVTELYAPIRRRLELVVPILLLLVTVGTLFLRTEITPLARRLRELATIDGLTGAFNRRAFMRFGELELAAARRYRRPFTMLMIDADHFKKVNDVYGHDAGDAVLRALSATLRKQLRDVDLFGRLGGEEFAVALPQTPAAGAVQVAERIRRALADLEVATGGNRLRFTVSIGVAAFPEAGDNVEALLKSADQALYAAKQGGRNRVILAGQDATPKVA
ncbi:MAG: GGDEF domain-containing protein [Pseudomonadota bacterium]